MWGEMTKGKTENTSWIKYIGYVGLVKRTYAKGNTATMYLCEAENQNSHDRGEFKFEYDENGVFSRGQCSLFDSPREVRDAASLRGVGLDKVLKVTYTESATFEEAE